MRRALLLLVLLAASLAACAGDDASLPRDQVQIPEQKRDPEQRNGESASVGASRPEANRPPPRGVTDLGREAEQEDEEIRQREKALRDQK